MSKIAAPGNGRIYHGVYPGGANGAETDVTKPHLDEYLAAVGRKSVAWVYFSHEWTTSRTFPVNAVDWIHATGAAPFVRLMLRSSDDQYVCEPLFTLKAIAGGKFDDDLKAWGRAAAARGVPLICEWGTEMNGMWFPWNAAHNGRKVGTQLFKDAYARIVKAIRAGGARDIVTWVFHVNHDNNPDEEWNTIDKYDPGPDLADWIGVSLYGAQLPTDKDWPVFSTRMERVYQVIESLPGKSRPVMICEFGFNYNKPMVATADPVKWADDALRALLSGRWPRVGGFAWWNEGWPNDGNVAPTEMRVQQIPGMSDLFRKLLSDPKVLETPVYSK